MRVINLKLKNNTARLLQEIDVNFVIKEQGYVEDTYALLRFNGNNIPSIERQEALAQAYADKTQSKLLFATIMVKKRVQYLTKLRGLGYFKALASFSDPIKATRRLFTTLLTTTAKKTTAQCVNCPHLKNCRLGQSFNTMIADITKMVITNTEKPHPSCPHLPEFSFVANITTGLSMMTQMQNNALGSSLIGKQDATDFSSGGEFVSGDEDEDDDTTKLDPGQFDTQEELITDMVSRYTPGDGRFSCKFTGDQYAKITETFVSKLSKAQLDIYELSAKLTLIIGEQKKGKFAPVEHIDHTKSPTNIKTASDVQKLVSSQHGLPDELFETRLEKKSLIKDQEMKPESRSQLLYILIDASASMQGQLKMTQENKYGLTRYVLAQSFSIAAIQRVIADKGVVYVRFFDGHVSPMYVAKNKDDVDDLEKTIRLCKFSGNSTNIPLALLSAVTDITQSKDNLAKAEILLMTDCEDAVNRAVLEGYNKKVPIHILDISGTRQPANMSMKEGATKYYKVNETLDLNKMVELL